MAWKLAVMVLAIGATACGLLVLRQQEIDLLASETDLRIEAEDIEQKLQMTRWELENLTQDPRFERWFEEQGYPMEPVDLERSGNEPLAFGREVADDHDSDALNIARGSDRRDDY